MSTTTRQPTIAACLGTEEPQTGNYFVATYPPFSCWAADKVSEVARVLGTPRPLATVDPLGLYVHVPFCATRCDFCYYVSYTGTSRNVMDGYVDSLLRELAIYARAPALAGRKVEFVYFGGGTPSILSVPQIRRCLRGLQAIFPWTSAQEVTFECAPKTITEPKLRLLRDCGVSRISLGVQQLNDDVLEKNGRIHLVRDVERAYAAIRRVGFEIVNVDLMVGMAGETDDSFGASLENVVEMQPESVTIYQMEIPPNTPLYRAQLDGTLDVSLDSWDVKRARLAHGFARLNEAGYVVRSAYSAVRDSQRHQFVYQESLYRGADLMGLGVASFSYFASLHYQNFTSLTPYLARVDDGQLPLERAYALADEERMIREFVLQLKLGRVETRYFRDRFGLAIGERFAQPLSQFAAAGWLTVDGDAVTLTRDGLLRVDRMLSAFYLPEHARARYW